MNVLISWMNVLINLIHNIYVHQIITIYTLNRGGDIIHQLKKEEEEKTTIWTACGEMLGRNGNHAGQKHRKVGMECPELARGSSRRDRT